MWDFLYNMWEVFKREQRRKGLKRTTIYSIEEQRDKRYYEF